MRNSKDLRKSICRIAAVLSQLICIGYPSFSQPLSSATLTQNLAVQGAIAPQPAAAVRFSMLSVKQFGAVGNGIADDTQAIQSTVKAATQQGKAVFFPQGIYQIQIQPQLSRALTLYKNTVLIGEGYRKSILRLANPSGNYSAILAGSAPDSDLSNIAIRGLTIDGNAALNPVKSEQDFKAEKDRFGLRVYVGRNIHVENCRFTNLDTVNVLTFNNDQLVSDIKILNNIFDNIGGGQFDHDHSTLYIHGKRSLIKQNIFSSRNGPGTKGARTAIETHGDSHQVLKNRISGYTYGINVTGVASSSKDQLIQANIMAGVHTGILLWSFRMTGMQEQSRGLEKITVDHNQIDIDVLGWRKLWGDSPNQGIALEPNSDAPIQTLKITGNEIAFHNFQDAGRATDTLAAGVILWRSKAPHISSSSIVIAQNWISNPLASGLYIAMPMQHLEINQNTVLNTGQGRYPFHAHYRSGMILGGGQHSMQVQNNQLIDNQSQPTMKVGMLWQGDCALCTQTQNHLTVLVGGVPLLLQTP
jgi:Pectate lyase superfamily protein